jgi:sugar lactone lactonase YvrE
MGLLPALADGQVNYTPYAFTTLAGKASIGSADGPGEAARFSFPFDVAVDRAGNLYVADTDNHTVRKITPDGVVATLAGLAGISGSADGVGSAARFFHPQGIAVDLLGDVYVADTNNQTIRKITPGGLVSTLAGLAGSGGNLDGVGSGATFDGPGGVAVDGAGNVYVAEIYGYRIRKVTATGTVTTLFGSPDDTSFWCPRGLAVDAWGNLFVADTLNDRICKFTPGGAVTPLRLADGTVASFYRPQKLGVDAAGNVYVADAASHQMLRFTPAGDLTTFATLPVDPPTDQVGLPYADGVAVDALGNVFVADTGNSAIRRITPGGVVGTVAGFGPAFGSADGAGSAARFFYPAGVAADASANLYAADSANHTIRKITPAGVVTTLAGLAQAAGAADGTGSAALFHNPTAVAVDAAGNVYVADTGNYTVRKMTPAGVVTTLAGLAGSAGQVDGVGSAARFVAPKSLAVDAASNVYVADIYMGSPIPKAIYSAVIRKITPAGEVTLFAGLSLTRGGTSIAVDPAGNVYAAVEDAYNMVFDTSSVYKVTPDGTVSILAGSTTTARGNSVDGTGDAARFAALAGAAVDSAGNVYVMDSHAVRRITPQGVVTTLAGVADAFGSTDGVGSVARFNGPSGIAVDATGRLYVADTDNHTIRMGVAGSLPVILTQPQSLTASAGANVQFTVTVAGSPEPTLQWLRTGSAISGATDSTLTLAGVQSSDAGDYTVTAANALGSATSNKATLTVTAANSGTSSGGGGGTMEGWFAGALAALAAARWMAGRGRARLH